MILSENQLRVPGKMFKVRVKCVSTRRLTTIEWLILSCTQKFENSSTMAGRTLKYAFEEVFQFQNSELLIKPCLRNLRGLKVIRISGGDNFDYNSLTFADIEVTELGQYMLKEGLLPGEPREMPLDIYYNPLTGRMNHYDMSGGNAKDAIDFGTESDYVLDFPEQQVIDALQAGSVGGGRFTASKFRIEEIEAIASSDWDSVITITTDIGEDRTITTNPPIIADGVKGHIESLFLTKEINRAFTNAMPEVNYEQVRNIVGSGKAMKTTVLDVCKNGKVLFMDAKVYALFKRNTSAFKDTTLILFNDENGFSIENEKGLIIHLPDPFTIEGCAVVNEKGAHVCLAKAEYKYEEKPLIVPVAYEDRRLSRKNKVAMTWLQDTVKKHMEEDVQYAALYTLPLLQGDLKKVQTALYKRWNAMPLSDIVAEIDRIHIACVWLKTEMFQINLFADALIEKIDFADYENALSSIQRIMESNCIRKRSESHRMMVERLVDNVKMPTNYRDLFLLLQALGINSHDEALTFDDLIGGLYTKTIIADLLTAIATGTYTKLPELFEYDAFFNEYKECVDLIELYVSGLKLFEKCEEASIQEAIAACPDLASLQSYMSELRSMNAQLLDKKINVYDVLKKSAPDQASAYVDNMRMLERGIERSVNAVYEQVEKELTSATVEADVQKKKIYILDTCAIMHHPEIFLYFADDEYVRIPTKVIDELGKIKDKRNKKYDATTADTARMVAREIDRSYLQLFNRENRLRFMIENAAADLLPKDLDPTVPDNQILSVALKYKDWDTVIVSDDGVFRLTAIAQKLEAMKAEQFIEAHKESYKSLEDRVKEYNAAGKTTVTKEEPLVTPAGEAEEDPKAATHNLVNTIANAIGQTFEGEEKEKKEEAPVQALAIDDMPIRELKKYVPDFNEPVFSYLQSNRVKTIGDFRMLTEAKVRNMPAKGKQMVYKNTVMRAVKQMDSIIPKIKLK